MPRNLQRPEHTQRAVGQRAEHVAGWYLRVNGFMTIPGFVVHLDQTQPRRDDRGDPIIQRTEADLVAVRFPYSREVVASRTMQDDGRVVVDEVSGKRKPLFVLAEVKAGPCSMNGPWTDRQARNMQRVLRRMGFTADETIIDEAAASLYGEARWEGQNVIVQYVCFGNSTANELQQAHTRLLQITWDEVGRFLHQRHTHYPEKTPGGLVHEQWPDFGRAFGGWFTSRGRNMQPLTAARATEIYIRTGVCRSET